MKISDIITEALLEMDGDVDRLYDIYFAESIEAIWKFTSESLGRADQLRSEQREKYVSLSQLIDDGIITNKKIIHASKLQPLTIKFMFGQGNVYRPYMPEIAQHAHILLDYNTQVYEIIQNYGVKYNSLEELTEDLIPQAQQKEFLNEMTPSKIKGSINHEFAHYVDDVLNNRHITDKLEKGKYQVKSKFNSDVDTYMEIEGQIHNIAQLKRDNLEQWDSMSFDDMISIHGTFQFVKRMPKVAYENWRKMLTRRMAREGLLGKSMR